VGHQISNFCITSRKRIWHPWICVWHPKGCGHPRLGTPGLRWLLTTITNRLKIQHSCYNSQLELLD